MNAVRLRFHTIQVSARFSARILQPKLNINKVVINTRRAYAENDMICIRSRVHYTSIDLLRFHNSPFQVHCTAWACERAHSPFVSLFVSISWESNAIWWQQISIEPNECQEAAHQIDRRTNFSRLLETHQANTIVRWYLILEFNRQQSS